MTQSSCNNVPPSPSALIRISTVQAESTKSQSLQRLRLASPQFASTGSIRLSLDRWYPACYYRPKEHASSKDDHNVAVPLYRFLSETTTEVVVGGKDLNHYRADLASAGAKSVTGSTVAGGEYFSRDDVRCSVGSYIKVG